MKNRVVYFEIPSADPKKSIDFFKEVFNWEFENFGDGYWSAFSGNENTQGINGAVMNKTNSNQTVVNTIAVDDADKYIKKIKKAGGKIARSKFSVPGIGYVVYFADPDGNIHGI